MPWHQQLKSVLIRFSVLGSPTHGQRGAIALLFQAIDEIEKVFPATELFMLVDV